MVRAGKTGGVRFSLVDVATIAVLVLAVALVSAPGGALNNAVHAWLVKRHQEAEVRREWRAVTRLAEPLYAAAGPPQIVEFADYQCPFCRADQAGVDSALARGLRVAVIQLPLPIHPRARPAALAAICAEAAGDFISVHRFLMTNDQWIRDSETTVIPGRGDAHDRTRYRTCEAAPSTRRMLTREIAMAETLGIAATPTFVSDRGIMGTRPSLASLLTFARKK